MGAERSEKKTDDLRRGYQRKLCAILPVSPDDDKFTMATGWIGKISNIMAGEGNRNKPETVWLEIAAGLEFYENGNDEAALKIELRDSDFHKGLREGDVVRFSALIHRRDELVAHQKEPACVQDASLLEVDEETGFDVKFTKIQKIEASE